MGLEHDLEIGQTRGKPVLLDRVHVVRVGNRFWGPAVMSRAGVPAGWCQGVLVGLGLGIRMDLLEPGGGQATQEAIQGLGVDVAKKSREVWERWVSPELALRQVVQELLSHPIKDAQSHVVGASPQLTIVNM